MQVAVAGAVARAIVWASSILAEVAGPHGVAVIILLAIATTVGSAITVATACKVAELAVVAFLVAFAGIIGVARATIGALESAEIFVVVSIGGAGEASCANALAKRVASAVVVARFGRITCVLASVSSPSIIAIARDAVCSWLAVTVADIIGDEFERARGTNVTVVALALTLNPLALSVAVRLRVIFRLARVEAALIILCAIETWPSISWETIT